MNGKEFESSVQETSHKPLNPVTLEPLKEDWRWVKLGEVIQEALPGFACGKRAGSDGFIQLRMNNISSHGQIDLSSILRVPATQEQVKKYRLVPGDVIFNNTNSVELVGKTALFNESEGIFLYSNHLTRLRSVPKILDTNYLASWLQLQWYQRVFEITCNRWIGQAAVQREKLLDFKIPLPPLLEQKRIAVKIQELMQEVDRARAACGKQLEAAKTLRSAYLRGVFESEESKKWERKRLGKICEKFVNGGTPDTGVPAYWDGQVPWITGADIKSFWVSSGRKFITEEGVKNSATHLVPKNTVLIVTRTGVGKVAIAANDLCFSQDITGIICSKGIYPEFLARFILSQANDFIHAQRGATIKGLIRTDLENLEIPIPPLSTQKCIAAELDGKIAQVGNLQSAIQNQQSALNALPQPILEKAFRGEL